MKRTDLNLWSENYHMLTAGQLMNKIDTLKLDIASQPGKIKDYSKSFTSIRKDESDFSSAVERRHLEKREIKIASALLNIDSLSTDSILLSPVVNETHTRALDNARNLKNYITGINAHVKYKKRSVVMNNMMIHKKFTLSIACIILFLIGAPMGAIVRKGGFGFPILIAIVFFLFFHVLNITGEKLVKQMIWPPFKGMWFPIIVLLPIGLFLTYKAANDSRLFNWEAYINSIKELKPFRRQKSG